MVQKETETARKNGLSCKRRMSSFMKRNTKFFAAMLAAVMIFSAGVYSNPDRIYANQKLNENVTNAQADTAVSGIQVAYHTQKEIVDYVKAYPAGKNDKLTYKKNPSFSGTYNIGEISAATQNSALNMLKPVSYTHLRAHET